MRPKQMLTTKDVDYWRSADPDAKATVFQPPDDMAGCQPCPAVVALGAVRVAWELDEIELTHLAQGGTLWLSTWGGLPPHMLEVQEP
jgi:hypothetical protein